MRLFGVTLYSECMKELKRVQTCLSGWTLWRLPLTRAFMILEGEQMLYTGLLCGISHNTWVAHFVLQGDNDLQK